MASPTEDIKAFAQSVYLTLKNRYYDDIAGEDGQEFIRQVIDWTNMYLDELENTLGPDDQPVDWWFSRSNAYELGTATAGDTSIDVPAAVDHLVTDELRYVQIQQDGATVSNWKVVAARDITNSADRVVEKMCAVVGNSLVFSRAFDDTEEGGTVVGDVVTTIPRIAFKTDTLGTVSILNAKVLSVVKPKQLLVLGVAKNASLPDIVQGKLSPNYSSKYDRLLRGAIVRSQRSSQPTFAERDSYGWIGSV